jgi:anti-sigma factor RsiW
MNCKIAKELILLDYADGIMAGSALEELESHIKVCRHCRTFAANTISAIRLFREAGQVEAPQAVWDKVLTKVSVSRYFYRAKPVLMAVASAVILIFGLITARIIVDRNSYLSSLAGEEIISIVSLQNWSANGEYDMGTSVEAFLL